MSVSTLVGIRESGEHCYALELRNSWGSAPLVWNALAMKYLGKGDYQGLDCVEDIVPALNDADAPRHHCILMALTFNRCVVTRKDFSEVAEAIDEFLVDFPVPGDRVNHWPTIARFFRETDEEAVGIWHTSVSESPYDVWDEDMDESTPVPIGGLFDVIEAVTEPRAGSRVRLEIEESKNIDK